MLQPNGKIKYRRVQRGRMKGKASRGNRDYKRRFRSRSAGAGMDHIQPDRGSPYCYDTLHQAWRSGLDQDIP